MSTAIKSPRAQAALDAASALRIVPTQAAEGDVSRVAPGATEVSVSRDGSVVGFISDAALVGNDRNGLPDVYGTIKVKLPSGGGFIDLGAAAGLPVGTQVDATDGVIELSSAVQAKATFASASARKVQRARFRDGIFTIRQAKGRRSSRSRCPGRSSGAARAPRRRRRRRSGACGATARAASAPGASSRPAPCAARSG